MLLILQILHIFIFPWFRRNFKSCILGKIWLYQIKLTISKSWLLWYDWNQWHMFCNFFSLVLKWFAWQYTFPLKLWLEVEISKEFAVWFGWLNKKNVYTQIFLRFLLTVRWSDLILDRNLTTFHPLFLYKKESEQHRYPRWNLYFFH